MNGTKAIEFHKILRKHKFTDQEANNIIEFVEHQNGELVTKKDLELGIAPLKRDIDWIKWTLGTILVLIIGLAGAMYYLHSDTKHDIRRIGEKQDHILEKINEILPSGNYGKEEASKRDK